ncbi:recombinase family protein [Risungbinella massiliensis]|uniref:recombinase family protein n=1 Tax=Risungbinella massiliensis TaxID=1329796 RepID=UPI0005CBBD6F|nr:recombinase family protein [Risungbinella massiliensis]
MKVAVYVRVSTDDQQDRGTIENQLEFARKYCDLHQFDVVEWYKDDGVSGTLPLEERDAGAKLLNDATKKNFDLLLIYKLDRLSRSARVTLNAVHELEKYGIKIKSMTEPFDTGDPNGRFMLTMLAGVADLERETILERMWYGANRAARAGKWLGGIVPYGYRVNHDGFLEINDDPTDSEMSEKKVIELIFHLVGEKRWSTIKVCDHLNDLGIPPHYARDNRKITKNKRKKNTIGIWHPGRIRTIVMNTTYMGVHYYGQRSTKEREIIERKVPAIISSDLWKKAQNTLKENQIFSKKNAVRHYLLSGLIKCGICGLTYHGQAFKGPKGKLKQYYQCNGKLNYISKKINRCESKNLNGEWIEKIVWDYCVSFIQEPSRALEEISATFEEKKNEHDWEMDLKILTKQLNELDNEKESILDLFRKKMITSDDVEKQFGKIQAERDQLSKKIEEITHLRDLENDRFKGFQSVEELLKSLRYKISQELTDEEKKEIVRTLVKKITVNTIFDGEEKVDPSKQRGRKKASVEVEFHFLKLPSFHSN